MTRPSPILIAIVVTAITALSGCAARKHSASAMPGAVSTNAYLLLADGSVHSDPEGPPDGLYVRGKLQASGVEARTTFAPVGDVEGNGPLAGDGPVGSPGWMELGYGNAGRFHHAQEAVSPIRPYITGVRTNDGIFRPNSRQVVYR